MNWRKAFDTIVNWWSGVAAVAAAIAFLIPFLNAPTDQDPTGGAEPFAPFAPVVALCVAAMILAEAVKGGGLRVGRMPSIFIGLGSMGSAYLWMAAESDCPPTRLRIGGDTSNPLRHGRNNDHGTADCLEQISVRRSVIK